MSNYDKIQRLFKKKLRLIEEAIEENNTAEAFASKPGPYLEC